MNVYERFIEEVKALGLDANLSAVQVVGELTRACKRAQNQVDFEAEMRDIAIEAVRRERDDLARRVLRAQDYLESVDVGTHYAALHKILDFDGPVEQREGG